MVPIIKNLLCGTSCHTGTKMSRFMQLTSRRIHRSNITREHVKHLAPYSGNIGHWGHGLSEEPRRKMSTNTKTTFCEKLTRRGLVRLAGPDTNSFLQGIITNDMNNFEGFGDTEPYNVMYTMMLNVQGRVLYDMILYHLKEEAKPTYLVECEAEVIPELMKVMKRYKIRKKVDISDVSNEYNIWAAFPDRLNKTETQVPRKDRVQLLRAGAIISPDPRLSHLGRRIVLSSDQNAASLLKGATETHGKYIERRYQLGVGEGVIDLPPGGALPLESNLVFLNGVSFSKGCYIGQELTARSHHTGVIRKRLMPLLMSNVTENCTPGDNIENVNGKGCGKYRNSEGTHGLGLIRMHDALGKGPLSIIHKEGEEKDSPTSVVAHAETSMPNWWPTESDEIIKQVLSKMPS